MQSENPMIADFVKLMNSAAATFTGMTREAREAGRERIREALGGLDFVSRQGHGRQGAGRGGVAGGAGGGAGGEG